MSKEALDQVIKGTFPTRQLHACIINFVCIAVRGDTFEMISKKMGIVSDLAIRYHGMIHDQVSGIIIVTFGILSNVPNEAESRTHLCEALRSELGADIKIVYGEADGHFGLLGGEQRKSYSFIVPLFLEALGMLAQMPYGEIGEFKADKVD